MLKAIAIVSVMLAVLSADSSSDYWNAGDTQAKSILGEFKSNFKARTSDPLTDKSELSTLDNSEKGDASLTCGKEEAIMKVSYSTDGGGDIDLNVQEDLDLDGKYEKSFSLNGISGVCANGFIKCDSGTWNNCKYYKWSFTGSNISYIQTELKSLGGCYCVNSSCGSIAVNSKLRVSSDIAGGIANTLNSYYIVSDVRNNADSTYVFGKSINCGGTAVPEGMDESQMETKAQEAKTDTNSSYYVLTDTATNVNNNPVDSSFKSSLISSQTQVAQSAKWDESSKTYSASTADGESMDGGMYVGDINKSKYCEVEWTATDTAAYSDNTNKANSTSSATTIKTQIRECVKSPTGTFVCPVDASKGETVKHDCGSVNDFGEIVSKLQGVNDATKDLTCSTN